MNIDPASDLGRKILALAGEPVRKPTRGSGCPSEHAAGWAVEWVIDLRPVNESNTGGPLGAKLGRKRTAKQLTRASLPPLLPPPPVRVTLTRLGGVRRMDGDGWQSAAKVIRDVVSEALGVDDGDRTRVTWVYHQRPAYGACQVRVRVEGV